VLVAKFDTRAYSCHKLNLTIFLKLKCKQTVKIWAGIICFDPSDRKAFIASKLTSSAVFREFEEVVENQVYMKINDVFNGATGKYTGCKK